MVLRRIVWTLAISTAWSAPAQQVLWRIDAPPQGPFGRHLAVIGDRDGDGFDDFVTTVYVPIPPGTALFPQVWFYSGRDGGILGQDLRAFGLYYHQIARAGDVDRDGVADYVVSLVDPQCPSTAPFPCTAVEVRSGRTSAVTWRAEIPTASEMGALLVGDLDLDGDRWPDILVGSPSATAPGGGFGGMVYALNRFGQVLYRVLSLPGENSICIGKFTDYDRDGCDDFLMGAYEQTGRGAVDIVSGRTGTRIHRIYGVPPVIWGFGASVAMAGDLDGDGVRDIILGDSGPFTPGVLEGLSSVTGNLTHRWQVNQSANDDFGWHLIADVDVDRDGVDDVVTDAWGQVGRGLFIYSGRDGSLIQNIMDPTGAPGSPFARVPPQQGDLFARFVTRSGYFSNVPRMYLLSGAPPGVRQSGAAGRGTLAAAPEIGVRQMGATGFRITLHGAESNAPALLVVGFSQPTLPSFNLPALGFTGCTLFPSADLIGFSLAGGGGIDSGFAAHEFRRGLAPSAIPGVSYQVFVQWVALGQGPTWPGGVSEAASLFVLR